MLYEITAEQEHINLIKKALQSYICSIYDALDEEIVDVDKAHEDIKELSDMLAVLKGQNGYRQTSESVGSMWMKEIDLDAWAVREYAEANKQTYRIKRNKACEQTDVICSEDECSNLTPEQVEWLQSRLKSKVGSKREVIVATPPLEDINLWNNVVKVVVERHKDELQSLADK